ncbi:hypothetical protein LINGRAHAP2_LOCUS9330 [Linum grandiflorum]
MKTCGSVAVELINLNADEEISHIFCIAAPDGMTIDFARYHSFALVGSKLFAIGGEPTSADLEVSLWAELSTVIDAEAVLAADQATPAIVAFNCFHVHPFLVAAKFALQPETNPPFPPETFEFVPIPDILAYLPPCEYLADFVGKVVRVGKPNYVERRGSVVPVQTIFVSDGRSADLEVFLWAELSTVIDVEAILAADQATPAIVAFSCFRVHPFLGNTCPRATWSLWFCLSSMVRPD